MSESDQALFLKEAQDAGITRDTVRARDITLSVFHKQPSSSSAPRETAILLVHGMTYSTLSVFDLHAHGYPRSELSAMLTLSARGHHVASADLAGYGFSEARSAPTTIAEHGLDLLSVAAKVRDHYPGARLVVIGWSWGAQIASRFCGTHTDAVDAFVYYASFWGGGPNGRPPSVRFTSYPPLPRRINTAAHAGSDFATPGNYDPAVKEQFVERALRIDPSSPTDGFADIAQNQPLHDPTALTMPTLVIHGAEDPIAVPSDLNDFYRAIPHDRKRYVIVDRADHNIHMGNMRDRFFDEVDRFLRDF